MENVSLSPLQAWQPLLKKLQKEAVAVGIILKVRYSDRTLHLLLEGSCVSSRKEWVNKIQTLFQSAAPAIATDVGTDVTTTHQIFIYGRVKGKRYPAWKANIPLSIPRPQAADSGVETAQSARQRFPVRATRSLQPAVNGLKSGLKDNLFSPAKPVSSASEWAKISPEIRAQFSTLGSQQWLVRFILGLFCVGLLAYLYIGTWFIPQQVQHWSQLQPEIDRIKAVNPRNLRELETLNQAFTETIAELEQVSPLVGKLYQRSRVQIKLLQNRQHQLQYRQAIEQTGQVYLGEAKRLAAEATLMIERHASGDAPATESTTEYQRSLQQHWLAALYWLNQVPGHTFAAREKSQLLRHYQKAYWQTQEEAQAFQ